MINLDDKVEECEEVELLAQVGLPAEGLLAFYAEALAVHLGVVAGLVLGQTGSVVARNNLKSWYPFTLLIVLNKNDE